MKNAGEIRIVLPRHHHRTVAVLFDNHAEGLNPSQIQDLRFWADPANRTDRVLEKR